MQEGQIQGGYILLARKLFDSWLMDKPPLWMKLWVWMIGQANWKDREKLKRGQFITTAEAMRDAMSYHIGARICKPSEKEIRRAYEGLTKGGMVGRVKSTRGMVITVCNYDLYQTFGNYEGHREGRNEKDTKGYEGAFDTEVNRSKEGKEAVVKNIAEQKLRNLCVDKKSNIIKLMPSISEVYDIEAEKYIANKTAKPPEIDPYRTLLSWMQRAAGQQPKPEINPKQQKDDDEWQAIFSQT